MQLTVYIRTYCHLCADMIAALAPWQARYGFELETRDVDSDPAWEADFGDKVPVLCAGEREICHYFLDEAALREYFSAHSDRVESQP